MNGTGMDAVRSLLLVAPGDAPPPGPPADATLVDLTTITAADTETPIADETYTAARTTIAALIAAEHRVYLHVHPVASGHVRDDLRACLRPEVYGVSVPDLQHARQIQYVAGLLEDLEPRQAIHLGLTAIGGWIGAAAGVQDATAIVAASDRLTFLGFDAAALATSLGVAPDAPPVAHARNTLVLAATAAGRPVVEGAPTDHTAREAAAQAARSQGMRGMLHRDPSATAAITAIFPAPPDAET